MNRITKFHVDRAPNIQTFKMLHESMAVIQNGFACSVCVHTKKPYVRINAPTHQIPEYTN